MLFLLKKTRLIFGRKNQKINICLSLLRVSIGSKNNIINLFTFAFVKKKLNVEHN